jgi:hypothetical protein
MPPAEPETTGCGSGAAGFAPPLLVECDLLLVVFLEPAELLALPDEPPLPVEGVWVVPAWADECFADPVCLEGVFAAPLGETPPLLVVFVAPPLLVVFVAPPLLDGLECCLGLPAEVLVVAPLVVAPVVVCECVVEVAVAAAAADRVVLDFDPPPPHALMPTMSATEHNMPTMSRAPVSLRDRAPAATILQNYTY